MAHQDLIASLVATVRALNLTVRSRSEAELTVAGPDGASVRDVIRQLRDSELRFSQALKERLTGVPIPDMFGEEPVPATGPEVPNEPTNFILSQFVTARESVLAMLHSLDDPDWDQTIEGGTTIATRIKELTGHDRQSLDQIAAILGTRIPS